jgi:CubicO group peptidase (beta-lactamase class C family)
MTITLEGVVTILLGTLCVPLALSSVAMAQAIDQPIPHGVKQASVEAATDRASQIDSLMRQLHEQRQFNGEVLVAQRGTVIYRGAFGLSDPGEGRAYTPDTPSCLASLSKPFTALAIMMLAEQRRLEYDDRIVKYFPGLKDAIGTLTIRQLLTHTSGIPDYPSLNIEHPGMANAEVLSALEKVPRPLFPAGEKYQYSNSGYVLLGLIVEKVAGEPLARFLQDRVFAPLKMKDSFVLTSAEQKTAVVARGYDARGHADDYPGYVTGDGGAYSTVNDLLRFDQALYTDTLVNQKTLAEAFTPGRVREGQTTYGFGWNAASDSTGRRVWHTGNTAGFRAFIERRLDDKITVIMLTNGGDTNRIGINDAIQRILAGQRVPLPQALSH